MGNEFLENLEKLEKTLEDMEKFREEQEEHKKRKNEQKESFKKLIDLSLAIDGTNKPMRILKTRINIDENTELIMDTTHTNDDETNEKILKFFLEIDSLISQFIDYTGLEKKDDN